MKNLFLLFVLAAALVSCEGNKTEKAAETENTAFTVVEMSEQIADFVGEEVTVEGTVAHVCTHGGDKMHLTMHDNKEERMVVFAGESGSFVADEVLGKKVIVTGIVEELKQDEAWLAKLEAELEAEIAEHKSETAEVEVAQTEEEATAEDTEAVEENDGPTFEEQVAAQREWFAEMREKIAASEKGYLSQYKLMVSTVEIVGEGDLNVGANKCLDEEGEGDPDHKHDAKEQEGAKENMEEGHDHEGHSHE